MFTFNFSFSTSAFNSDACLVADIENTNPNMPNVKPITLNASIILYCAQPQSVANKKPGSTNVRWEFSRISLVGARAWFKH